MAKPVRFPSPNRQFAGVEASAVSDFHTKESRDTAVQHHRLIQDVAESKRLFSLRQAQLEALRNQETDAKVNLIRLGDEAQALARAAEDTENDSSLTNADRLAKLSVIRQSMTVSQQAIHVQSKRRAELEQRIIADEHDLLGQEVDIARLLDRLGEASASEEARLESQRAVAAARANVDGRQSEAIATAVLRNTVAGLQQEHSAAERAASIQDNAHALRASAASMLAQTRQERESVRRTAATLRQEGVDRRVSAVLSLKGHLETVGSEIQGANARRAAARAAKNAQHAEEYHELLAAGKNPYEVWRARERDAYVERSMREQENAIALSTIRVAEHTIEDDLRTRPRELKKKLLQEQDEYHRKLKLPVRTQALTTAYIMSKTVGSQAVLDPTGRTARIDPSTVTAFKPPGFGLGSTARSRPDVVAAIAMKRENADVAPLSHWLPQELPDDHGDWEGTARAKARDVLHVEQPQVDELEPDPYGSAEEVQGSGRMGVASTQTGQGTNVKYPQRQLSVYEQRMMAAARERQRAGIVKKQIAAGKEFKGAGLLCQPAVLHFKDYFTGRPTVLQASLTNTSFTFNSFKILKLPDTVCDLFNISIVPPGRMSAGTSVPFSVQFDPRWPEGQERDIDTSIDILTQTGPVSIPLLATTRKAVPVVKLPSIDLGAVTLGETCVRDFVVENDAVLPCVVHVRPLPRDALHGEAAGKEGEEQEGTASMWNFPAGTAFSLPGYSSVRIPVRASPVSAGEHALPVRLSFDRAGIQPIECLARATGVDVPLYVEKPVVDLRTCLLGKLYRTEIVVKNRGTVALKCTPRVALPHGTLEQGEIEFHPTLGYVQARDPHSGLPGSFTFQVRFRPTLTLLERPSLAHLLRSAADTAPPSMMEADGEATGAAGRETYADALALAPLLSVPLSVSAPDQVLPVPVTLHARVSRPGLVFEPESVDFGPCFVGQAVSQTVTISNVCALPLKYGFPSLPPGYSVCPTAGEGLGLLLPGERQSWTVAFHPQSEGVHEADLLCHTQAVTVHRLHVTGVGVPPVLSLSHPCCFLAATAIGEVEEAFVHLTNNSSAAQAFHVLDPVTTESTDLPLTVSPTVGTLAPGQTIRLQLRYSPSTAWFDRMRASTSQSETALARAAQHLGALQAQQDASTLPHEGMVEERPSLSLARMLLEESAPQAVHALAHVPIYHRPLKEGGRTTAAAVLTGSSAAQGSSEEATGIDEPPVEAGLPRLSQATILHVSTCAVPRMLAVDQRSIAFGEASVGKGAQRAVRVTNDSEVALELVLGPLLVSGAFSLLTPPCVLQPHTDTELIVQFKPHAHRFFTDRLVVGAKGHGPLAEVVLSGQGVSPSLVLEPAGTAEAGTIAFGAVVLGDTATRTLTLKNTSTFPLSFTIRDVPVDGESVAAISSSRASPVPLFNVEPSQGSVPAGGAVQVKVMYTPRHAPPGGVPHKATFLIDVPNQDEGAAQYIHASGRCFERSVYSLPSAAQEELSPSTAHVLDTHLTGVEGIQDAGAEVYTLVFKPEDGVPAAAATSPRPASGGKAGGAGGTKGGGAAAATVDASTGTIMVKEMQVLCIDRTAYGSAAAATSPRPSSATAAKGGKTAAAPAIPAAAATAAGGAGASAAAYTVAMPALMPTPTGHRPHYFSIESPSGTVQPGERVVVKFKFSPPGSNSTSAAVAATSSSGAGAALPKVLLSAGEWHTLDVPLTVTGGYTAPGVVSEKKTVIVRLRGFVPPRSV